MRDSESNDETSNATHTEQMVTFSSARDFARRLTNSAPSATEPRPMAALRQMLG